MDTQTLLDALRRGEDSRQQFKADVTNVDALAAELVAFANAVGGRLIIGVDDRGEVRGLTRDDIARLNQLVSNAASQAVRPPINPLTDNVVTDQGLVMVVTVAPGLNRPYMDGKGRIWVKSGADKRQVTAREEMQRMFQDAGLIQAEAVPVAGAAIGDLDRLSLRDYLERRYGLPLDDQDLPRLLENLDLARDGVPNLAGLLLFGRRPQRFRPAFMVKAVAFAGSTIHEAAYRDSEDIEGSLPGMYKAAYGFVLRQLRRLQNGQGVNSPGVLEVPAIVFEELLVNALIHRDYFISAPIRLLVFDDRIEIISPGHLPNHLTTAQVRYGVSNMRNPILASHGTYLLPYRGIGSGILRAYAAYPDIELIDDRDGRQFKVVVARPAG
jgi:predicted HTH transcriptional regulator